MGNKESKRNVIIAESQIKTNSLKFKNKKQLELFIEEQKQQYEERYKELENNYTKLQEQFLEMKSKFDVSVAGDFVLHSIEIRDKLQDALNEKEITNNNDENISNNDNDNADGNDSDDDNDDNDEEDNFLDNDNNNKIVENKIINLNGIFGSYNNINNSEESGDGNIILLNEENYKEKFEELQNELENLVKNNIYKKKEIADLKEQLIEVERKSLQEKQFIIDEFNTKGLLLREKFEEEKKHLIEIWEQKLLKTIDECHNEITAFKNKHNKEKLDKFDLKEKLERTEFELSALEKKHKVLNTMYEEIRERYESRESRLEDLEKIADLEGQLIIHAEELEKQKELLKRMKNTKAANDNVMGRRAKKNAKKHRKHTQNI